MRRFILCLILAVFPYTAFAYSHVSPDQNWDIKNFSINIQIHEDSSLEITETIQADFTREPHHGIIRFIPVKNTDTDGKRSSIRLKIVNITDEKGAIWPFKENYQDDFVIFKIGDPDHYINKIATFNITYAVEDAITNFPDHDELYWNATGDRWDVRIEKTKTIIALPQGSNIKDLHAKCFSGRYGSKEQNCISTIKDEKTFEYTITGDDVKPALQSNEGLTVVAGFPKNIVASPSLQKRISWFLSDNWGYFIPLFVFFFMFYKWYTKGRDPLAKRAVVMPFYEPPDNLTPGEVGTIVDEKVDIQDINAGIIDLAVRGYLKIIETVEKKFLSEDKNYKFVLLKKDFAKDPDLIAHEKQTLKAIFKSGSERDLSDLKEKFYETIPGIKNDIYEKVVKDGYFPTNPDTVRNTYSFCGLAICFFLIFIAGGALMMYSFSVFAGVVISAILIMIFGRYMPAKTKKGAETYIKILGLKEYINTAEKDRLKFQEKENIFEKLLPYAMTLGIADKWTKAFEGIYKTPPSWYQSNNPNFLNNFSTLYFLNSLNGLSSSMESAFQSSPRSSGSGFSSGGGFSGGGGGGGGGSGW